MNSEYHCESKPLYQLQVVQVVLFLLSILQIINWKLFFEKSFPFQSTFIAPMQSTKQFSSQLLSSSIGVSGGNAGVNNEGYQNSLSQLSVGILFSTQDLSSA